MYTLRTLVLALAAAAAVVTPLATTASAEAATASHSHHHVYYVYYRTCVHSPWVCYGGYYHTREAAQAVNYFRYYGYESYYRS